MSTTKVLLGFVAGAAVGALAGVLFAPDSGKNTREKIAGKAGDMTDSLKTSFNDFVDNLKNTYTGAKEEAANMGRKAKEEFNTATGSMG